MLKVLNTGKKSTGPQALCRLALFRYEVLKTGNSAFCTLGFRPVDEFISTIMSITERLQWTKGEDFTPGFVLCCREVTRAGF